MKIVCPACTGKARIVQRQVLNPDQTIAHLYCHCLDVKNCGATFRYCLSFDHYLNPPVRSTNQLAAELVSRLTSEEKKQLQSNLFN